MQTLQDFLKTNIKLFFVAVLFVLPVFFVEAIERCAPTQFECQRNAAEVGITNPACEGKTDPDYYETGPGTGSLFCYEDENKVLVPSDASCFSLEEQCEQNLDEATWSCYKRPKSSTNSIPEYCPYPDPVKEKALAEKNLNCTSERPWETEISTSIRCENNRKKFHPSPSSCERYLYGASNIDGVIGWALYGVTGAGAANSYYCFEVPPESKELTEEEYREVIRLELEREKTASETKERVDLMVANESYAQKNEMCAKEETSGLIPCGQTKSYTSEVTDGVSYVTCSCEFKHLIMLIQNIIKFLILLGAPVAALMFAYGGFLYLTGESGKISTAKSIFKNVILGLVLMLSAWGIVSLITTTLIDKDKAGDINSGGFDNFLEE